MSEVCRAKAIDMLSYRFGAIQIGLLALEKRLRWAESESKVCIFVDGKLDTEAATTAFTNSAIESAIIHSRVLLEFLGLKVGKTGIESIKTRRTDDLYIEHEVFGGLKSITPDEAVKTYSGPTEEAEQALVYVIHLANKGLAHSTIDFEPDNDDFRLLNIAFRGVENLMENRFYVPLGIEVPASPVSEERRKRSHDHDSTNI